MVEIDPCRVPLHIGLDAGGGVSEPAPLSNTPSASLHRNQRMQHSCCKPCAKKQAHFDITVFCMDCIVHLMWMFLCLSNTHQTPTTLFYNIPELVILFVYCIAHILLCLLYCVYCIKGTGSSMWMGTSVTHIPRHLKPTRQWYRWWCFWKMYPRHIKPTPHWYWGQFWTIKQDNTLYIF